MQAPEQQLDNREQAPPGGVQVGAAPHWPRVQARPEQHMACPAPTQLSPDAAHVNVVTHLACAQVRPEQQPCPSAAEHAFPAA